MPALADVRPGRVRHPVPGGDALVVAVPERLVVEGRLGRDRCGRTERLAAVLREGAGERRLVAGAPLPAHVETGPDVVRDRIDRRSGQERVAPAPALCADAPRWPLRGEGVVQRPD